MTTIPALAAVPVTDDATLTQQWADLLTPGPVGAGTLWVAWLRPDGTMLPVIVPIENVPSRATLTVLGNLVELHLQVAERHGMDPDELHLTMTLERPGDIGAGFHDSDDEWLEVIDGELAESLEQRCSFHVFDGRSVLPLLPRSQWPQ
jgi:hypothetical protein